MIDEMASRSYLRFMFSCSAAMRLMKSVCSCFFSMDSIASWTAAMISSLENTLTGQHFEVLILPYCKVLPLEAAVIAEVFADNGGHIICVEEVPSMGVKPGEDAEVRSVFERIGSRLKVISESEIGSIASIAAGITCRPVEIVSGTSTTVNNHMSYGDHLIDPYVHTGEDITGVMFNSYVVGDERRTLFMNYGRDEEQVGVRIRSRNVPLIFDTLSGEVSEPSDCREDGENFFFTITLPATHGIEGD